MCFYLLFGLLVVFDLGCFDFVGLLKLIDCGLGLVDFVVGLVSVVLFGF